MSNFKIRKSNSFDVDTHVSRVKHGTFETLQKLYFTFPSIEEAASFGIDSVLRAANLPDSTDGRLDVVIMK